MMVSRCDDFQSQLLLLLLHINLKIPMQSSCGLAPKSASGIFVTSKKSGSSFQNCSLAGANRLYFAKRIVLAAVDIV